jgi:hypothetical protein
VEHDDNSSGLKALAAKAWRAGVIAIWAVREVLRTAWGIARQPVITALQIIAALIIIFEEWGWRPLADALARLARFGIWAALEARIAALPPYGALLAFAIPVAILFPFKLLALYLLALGDYSSAAVVFVAAKLVGTALLARIFTLTKPALMEIGWFAAAYNTFVPWKDALFETIRASRTWRYGRMLKTRVRLEVVQAWTRWRPMLAIRFAGIDQRLIALAQRLRVWLRGS